MFASLLLPWIRVHPSPGGPDRFDPAGGIADSFLRQRILFAGYEAAWVLLSLARLSADPIGHVLERVAGLCIEGAARVPMGTGFHLHTRWAATGQPDKEKRVLGPLDSRRLSREAEFALRIGDEFP